MAEDAGFTKGAFYANFKSKEELFLAMLDERFAERLEEIDRATGERRRAGGAGAPRGRRLPRYLRADPEWQRLFFEFAAHAARNDDFREELVTRYGALRERIATVYRAARSRSSASSHRSRSTRSPLMTFAMANGVALEQLLEPDAVPDDLFGTMLMVFFTGLRTLIEESGQALPAGSTA